jgi:hypothetical protein
MFVATRGDESVVLLHRLGPELVDQDGDGDENRDGHDEADDAAGLPLTVAVLWGTFVAPNASVHVPGAVHVLLQVIVFGCAAGALYSLHRAALASAFAGVVTVNAALMIAMGQ